MLAAVVSAALGLAALTAVERAASEPVAKRPKTPYMLRTIAKGLAEPLYVTVPSGVQGRLTLHAAARKDRDDGERGGRGDHSEPFEQEPTLRCQLADGEHER
jgi:hypothetical protein